MKFVAEQNSSDRLSAWVKSVLLLLVPGYFLAAVHPYIGIRHDGILYSVQALYRLYPEIFAQDVFFKFGSQDSFSIFSSIYAVTIQWLGFEAASVSLLAFAHAAFVVAACLWVRKSLPETFHWAAMIAICLSAGGYGGMLVFHYAEAFLTARPYAEALTILALPLIHDRRYWPALALLGVAALVHPLAAIPGLAFWWLVRTMEDRRWGWIALLALPCIAAGYWGVEPFAKLFQNYDFNWRSSVILNNAFVFMQFWAPRDHMMLATDFVLLSIALGAVPARLRTMVLAILLVGAGATLISLIGADLLSNVLVTSLQLWRTQWLMHFFAMTALVPIVVMAWKQDGAGRITAMLLVYAAIGRGTYSGFGALILALVMMFIVRRRPVVIETSIVRLVGMALVAGLVAAWVSNVHWHLADTKQANWMTDIRWGDVVLTYLRRPPVGPLLVALPLLWITWRFRKITMVSVTVVAILLAVIASSWDQRSDWARTVEQMPIGEHPFSRHVQPNQEVYWLDDAFAPWLMMKRRSYVSAMQSAGQPFNRETAAEVARRHLIVASFDFQAQLCRMMNLLNKTDDACEPDIQSIRFACESDSTLGFVVTKFNIPDSWQAQWEPPRRGAEKLPTYYLYSCRQLLAAPADNPAPKS